MGQPISSPSSSTNPSTSRALHQQRNTQNNETTYDHGSTLFPCHPNPGHSMSDDYGTDDGDVGDHYPPFKCSTKRRNDSEASYNRKKRVSTTATSPTANITNPADYVPLTSEVDANPHSKNSMDATPVTTIKSRRRVEPSSLIRNSSNSNGSEAEDQDENKPSRKGKLPTTEVKGTTTITTHVQLSSSSVGKVNSLPGKGDIDDNGHKMINKIPKLWKMKKHNQPLSSNRSNNVSPVPFEPFNDDTAPCLEDRIARIGNDKHDNNVTNNENTTSIHRSSDTKQNLTERVSKQRKMRKLPSIFKRVHRKVKRTSHSRSGARSKQDSNVSCNDGLKNNTTHVFNTGGGHDSRSHHASSSYRDTNDADAIAVVSDASINSSTKNQIPPHKFTSSISTVITSTTTHGRGDDDNDGDNHKKRNVSKPPPPLSPVSSGINNSKTTTSLKTKAKTKLMTMKKSNKYNAIAPKKSQFASAPTSSSSSPPPSSPPQSSSSMKVASNSPSRSGRLTSIKIGPHHRLLLFTTKVPTPKDFVIDDDDCNIYDDFKEKDDNGCIDGSNHPCIVVDEDLTKSTTRTFTNTPTAIPVTASTTDDYKKKRLSFFSWRRSGKNTKLSSRHRNSHGTTQQKVRRRQRRKRQDSCGIDAVPNQNLSPQDNWLRTIIRKKTLNLAGKKGVKTGLIIKDAEEIFPSTPLTLSQSSGKNRIRFYAGGQGHNSLSNRGDVDGSALVTNQSGSGTGTLDHSSSPPFCGKQIFAVRYRPGAEVSGLFNDDRNRIVGSGAKDGSNMDGVDSDNNQIQLLKVSDEEDGEDADNCGKKDNGTNGTFKNKNIDFKQNFDSSLQDEIDGSKSKSKIIFDDVKNNLVAAPPINSGESRRSQHVASATFIQFQDCTYYQDSENMNPDKASSSLELDKSTLSLSQSPQFHSNAKPVTFSSNFEETSVTQCSQHLPENETICTSEINSNNSSRNEAIPTYDTSPYSQWYANNYQTCVVRGKSGGSGIKDSKVKTVLSTVVPRGIASLLFTSNSVIHTKVEPAKEIVCIDNTNRIYVCDIGLSSDECDLIVETTEKCSRGAYAAYTYAKQTLGCREHDELAVVCEYPVMKACSTIRKHLENKNEEEVEEENSFKSKPQQFQTGHKGLATTASDPKLDTTWKPLNKKNRNLVLDDREPHIVKYDVSKKERQKLDMHTDKSEWTFLVALSEGCGNDYEGGGTYFEAIDSIVNIQKGHALIFPGKLRHRGQKITFGTRFLLVGFLVDKSSEIENSTSATTAAPAGTASSSSSTNTKTSSKAED